MVGDEPLLEAQRVAAVLVVAAVAGELAVAALAVAGDGGVVCLVHLEPHREAERASAAASAAASSIGPTPRPPMCGATAIE